MAEVDAVLHALGRRSMKIYIKLLMKDIPALKPDSMVAKRRDKEDPRQGEYFTHSTRCFES